MGVEVVILVLSHPKGEPTLKSPFGQMGPFACFSGGGCGPPHARLEAFSKTRVSGGNLARRAGWMPDWGHDDSVLDCISSNTRTLDLL